MMKQNMKTKFTKYNLIRYYKYGSEKSSIYVPDGMKFMKTTLRAMGDSYIAVVPYNEDIDNESISVDCFYEGEKMTNNTFNQTLALYSYNIDNKYIVWELKDVLIEDKNFPITNEIPSLLNGLCLCDYIENNANINELIAKVEEISKNKSLSKEEKNNKLFELTRKPGKYYKINKITDDGRIDATIIRKYNFITNEDTVYDYVISRDIAELDTVLGNKFNGYKDISDDIQKVISSDMFENVLKDTINKIANL